MIFRHSFLIRALFLLLPGSSGSGLSAQPLRTLYYSNGNKAAEGRWQYYIGNSFPTTMEHGTGGNAPRRYSGVTQLPGTTEYFWDNFWYLLSMKCEGLVRTWYEDGKLRSEISFRDGQPSGPCRLFHPDGKLALEGALVAGMPQGTWRCYYPNGSLQLQGRFLPYSQEDLHRRWQNYVINNDFASRYHTMDPQFEREEFIDSAEMPEAWYSGGEQLGFATYRFRSAFNRFFVRSISRKHGSFTYYSDSGRKEAEMAFRNNKRDGTWRLWSTGPEPVLTLEYSSGKLLSIKDSTGTWTPGTYVRYWRKLPPPEVISVIAAPQLIHKRVDSSPQFPGNLEAYIRDNLKLSKAEICGSIGRTIKLRFFIDTDGQVDKTEILEGGSNTAVDRKLIRVVNQMPPWIPGRIGGEAVRSGYEIEFSYGLKTHYLRRL